MFHLQNLYVTLELNDNRVSGSAELFVGIDGGSTQYKARLKDHQDKLLAETTSVPADAATGSMAHIIEACQQCLHPARIDPSRIKGLNVGTGLAGINEPNYLQTYYVIVRHDWLTKVVFGSP